MASSQVQGTISFALGGTSILTTPTPPQYCNAMQYNAMQYHAMQYSKLQYHAIQCIAMNCKAAQCNKMQASNPMVSILG